MYVHTSQINEHVQNIIIVTLLCNNTLVANSFHSEIHKVNRKYSLSPVQWSNHTNMNKDKCSYELQKYNYEVTNYFNTSIKLHITTFNSANIKCANLKKILIRRKEIRTNESESVIQISTSKYRFYL